MPYASTADLPSGLRKRLPDHAQEIFRAAFNHAWQEHLDASDREAVAHRIAWSAVKHRYMRQGDRWVEKP